jgi:hypothetical protein
MLMVMKGHNALYPCRMCMILGIRILDLQNKTLYMPLSPRNCPVPTDVVEYHLEKVTAALARSLYGAGQSSGAHIHRTQREELATAYGIKGSAHGVPPIPFYSQVGLWTR